STLMDRSRQPSLTKRLLLDGRLPVAACDPFPSYGRPSASGRGKRGPRCKRTELAMRPSSGMLAPRWDRRASVAVRGRASHLDRERERSGRHRSGGRRAGELAASRREEVRLGTLQHGEESSPLDQEPRRGVAPGQREDGEACSGPEAVQTTKVVIGEEPGQG